MPLVQLRTRPPGRADRGVALTPELTRLIAAGSPVAIGVSGGKDSCAAALATIAHLNAVGHTGPRLLVHADLGRVEWDDSLPTCERLAAATGAELITVRRPQGDMMDRWLQRWRDNCERYAKMKIVKLLLPWSTPDMRFCTSEMKIAPICRELKLRFPGQVIINADGVRRAESKKRKEKPIANKETGLAHPKNGTSGVHWRPIIEYSDGDVFALCAAHGFEMHEGYTRWEMDRISCVFCIMQSIGDMANSIRNPRHHPLYREMVQLEVISGYAFQGSRWLGDLAPELLSEEMRIGLASAKAKAAAREAIESEIPEHLLYVEGWPTVMPTMEEAVLLCRVRREIARIMSLEIGYTTPEELLARYAELMALNASREAEKAAKEARKLARAGKTKKSKPRN